MKNGFEFAFKGAMNAYGILAHKAVFWLGHVTGTGGESEAHYWPNDCDVCKEIAKFVSDWSPERQLTKRAADAKPRSGLQWLSRCVCPSYVRQRAVRFAPLTQAIRKQANMFENLLLDYQKEWLENPQFESGGHVHNWRGYVPDVFKEKWASLQIETRIAIILMAESRSDSEEWD